MPRLLGRASLGRMDADTFIFIALEGYAVLSVVVVLVVLRRLASAGPDVD